MGKGIVKLGEGNWAVKDGNLLAAKETNGRFKNAEFTVDRGTRASYVGRDGLIKESNLQDVNLVNNGDFSELGSELATNGDFSTASDWTLENGAVINNGSVNIIGVGSRFKQDVLTVGKTYKLDYQVVSTNGESFRFQDGVTAFADINQAVGYHTYYFEATGVRVQFQALGDINARIDNVSVKEVDPNDYWTLGTGWEIIDGIAVADGSISGNNYLISTGTDSVVGKTYKVVFTVSDYVAGNVRVRAGQFASDNVNANGTYTQYQVSSSTETVRVQGSSSFEGKIDNISVQEVKIDTPRIDFTDNTDGHLLLEPQSTNLVTYSQQFGGATDYFNNYNQASEVTNNNLAPDGTNTATQIVSTGDGKLQTSSYISLPANTTYTLSFFAKNVDATEVKSRILANGGSGGSNLTSVSYVSQINTSTWTRITHTFTTNSTSQAYILYLSNALNSGGNIQLWGAQLEALPYATSYMPTNGSTVTRDAETCTGAGETADFNSEEGVLYAEIAALANDGTTRRISLSDGSTSNRVSLELDETSNIIKAFISSGGVSQILQYTASDLTQYNKIAIKYKVNDFALWLGGVERDTDTFGSVPIGLNTLEFAQGSGSQKFYGKCKSIRVYKEALSDTDLQNLTS